MMKISRYHILFFLTAVSLLFLPVAAITTGNNTGIQSNGAIQTAVPTFIPTTSPSPVMPSFDIPQNVGFVPIWLIVGIILIAVALSGLLWRYFHPRYVPREENE